MRRPRATTTHRGTREAHGATPVRHYDRTARSRAARGRQAAVNPVGSTRPGSVSPARNRRTERRYRRGAPLQGCASRALQARARLSRIPRSALRRSGAPPLAIRPTFGERRPRRKDKPADNFFHPLTIQIHRVIRGPSHPKTLRSGWDSTPEPSEALVEQIWCEP